MRQGIRYGWVVLCLCWSSMALAWNATGHRLVARVAWESLPLAAQVEVQRLLEQHADFPLWATAVGGRTESGALIAEAAVWADAIRHDPRFGEGVAERLPGFPDMLRHSEWHYSDAQDGPDEAHLYDVLPGLQHMLADRSLPTAQRAYALVWLLHLVADAHQPLHNGFRDDRGGNEVRVIVFDPEGNRSTTLHAFWDDLPGRGKLGGTALLHRVDALLAEAKQVTTGTLNVHRWQQENAMLSRQFAYPGNHQSEPYVLPTAFVERAQRVANRQLALAGLRLAQVLAVALIGVPPTPFHVERPAGQP